VTRQSHRPPADDDTRVRIRAPRNRPDPRFVTWRTLQAVIGAVVVLGGLGALYGVVERTRPWLGPVLVVLAVVYLVNIAVMPTWRYRVHRWETTDDAVYALEGWLTRTWVVVPVSRIQSIDMRSGPLEQALGLATVRVTTASSEAVVTIEGLGLRVAEETVSRLKDITGATPGDAT
jgi:hypothetical protein